MIGRPTKTQDDTREQILKAAVGLLGDHGLPKLTQPQVAKKARVRQSHVTYYFPKRSDLVAAVANRYINSVAEEALKLAQTGKPLDALTTAALGDRRRVRTLISLLIASEEDPALRQQLLDSAKATRTLISQLLGIRDGHPLAAVHQATLWGLGLQHLLFGDQKTDQLGELVAHARRHVGLNAHKGKRSAA
jgi:AcrR family transcriptional regulator